MFSVKPVSIVDSIIARSPGFTPTKALEPKKTPSLYSPEYNNIRNFDYSTIDDTTNKTWNQLQKSNQTPILTPTDKETATPFQRYYPSPINPDNSPICITDQLISRGRGGITRTVDALSSLDLLDIKYIDEWICGLQSVLGRYLYTTYNRWRDSIQRILSDLTQRGIQRDMLLSIEKLLLLESTSETINQVTGEKMALEYVINQCKAMQIKAVNEYIETSTIFQTKDKLVSPGYVKRIKALYEQVSSDPLKTLQIDHYRYHPSSSTPSPGLTPTGTDTTPVPHDADIVITLFLHLCDSAFDASSKMYTNKFSSDHYADGLTRVPEPTLPGLSHGIDRVGIVRCINTDDDSTSSKPYTSPYPSDGGDIGRYNINTSPYYLRRREQRPHFNVYIVHDYNEAKYKNRINRHLYPSITTKTPVRTRQEVRYMSAMYEPWPEGDVGVELLHVIDGRQNCYEAIVVLLVLMVKLHDPAIKVCSHTFIHLFVCIQYAVYSLAHCGRFDILLFINLLSCYIIYDRTLAKARPCSGWL